MLTAIDLSKQQAFDGDPKTIQQTNFAGNLERAGDTPGLFISEEVIKLFWISYKERWKRLKSVKKNAIDETLRLLSYLIGEDQSQFSS